MCDRRFEPDDEHNLKYGKRFSMEKWKWLKESDIPISHKCCIVMKKRPFKKYEHETGRKPILATMACESSLRTTEWLKNGCNAWNIERPSSKPMSFWTEEDVLAYIKIFDLPMCSVYGDIVIDDGTPEGKPIESTEGWLDAAIFDLERPPLKTTGCDRTGCAFCGFGAHSEKEPNRFQRLKQTHPKIWEYCMKPWDKGGLGMKEVLEYIGVKIE